MGNFWDNKTQRQRDAEIRMREAEREKQEKLKKLAEYRDDLHGRRCEVCQHDEVFEINEAFIRWQPVTRICKVWGLDEHKLLNHVRYRKLDKKRWRNTEHMYSRLIELGLEQGESLNIKAADMIHAAQRLDKLGGREIDRVEVNGPPVIHLHGIPKPGGVFGKPPEALQEKVGTVAGPPNVTFAAEAEEVPVLSPAQTVEVPVEAPKPAPLLKPARNTDEK